MKCKKCLLALWLSVILLLGILPLSASANSPGPAIGNCFIVTDLPENTVYVDLLIPLPVSDPMYVDLVRENLSEHISPQSDIVAYCEDGFRSYTFHYRNAQSIIEVNDQENVLFFTNDSRKDLDDHREDVYNRGSIRLAMLDQDGSIIKVSPTLVLRAKGFLSSMIGIFDYNARTDEFKVREETSVIAWIVYISICIISLLLTVFTEGLVADCFRLKSFREHIKYTNIVSQILMHTSYVLLYVFFCHNYLLDMLILEALVYIGEFLFYRRVMRRIPAKKCFAYTVAANTASLMLGALLIGILL